MGKVESNVRGPISTQWAIEQLNLSTRQIEQLPVISSFGGVKVTEDTVKAQVKALNYCCRIHGKTMKIMRPPVLVYSLVTLHWK